MIIRQKNLLCEKDRLREAMEVNSTTSKKLHADASETSDVSLEPSVVQKKHSRKRNIIVFVVVSVLNVSSAHIALDTTYNTRTTGK